MFGDIDALLKNKQTLTVPLKPFFSRHFKPTVVVRVQRYGPLFQESMWIFSVLQKPEGDGVISELVSKLNDRMLTGDLAGLDALNQLVEAYSSEFQPALLVTFFPSDFEYEDRRADLLHGLIRNVFKLGSYARMLNAGRSQMESVA